MYGGFDVFKTYLAVKNHFTTDYDYNKYGGRVTAKLESFTKRPDRYFFHKLSKKFQNIYWMNPERSQYWNTGDSQFHHYQSISKKYSEVRNFEQLKTFINSINFKKVIK